MLLPVHRVGCLRLCIPLAVVLVLSLSSAVQAQSDGFAFVRHSQEEATALARQGETDEAVAVLEEAYPIAVELGPSFAAGVARQLGTLWYSLGRFDESASWYNRTLSHQAEDMASSARMTIDDTMRAAQSHEMANNLEEAVRLMEMVGDIANQSDPDDYDPYMVYQAWFQAASIYQQLGRGDDVTRAYEQASRWIREADRAGTVEDLMVEILRIEHGSEFDRDSGEKAEAIIATYHHPRFDMLPERLTLAGRYGAAVAYNAGRDDLLQPLAVDIFAEAARFEHEIGIDPLEYDIDLAYTQASMHLAGSYSKSGEAMLAAETLEHALFAFPDAELSQSLKRNLFNVYKRLGIDPEERRVHWDPHFHIATPDGLSPAQRDGGVGTGESSGVPDVSDESTSAVKPNGDRSVGDSGERRSVLLLAVAASLLAVAGFVMWLVRRG